MAVETRVSKNRSQRVRGVLNSNVRSPGPHEGKAFNIIVEQIVAERLFSFRWHPYAIELGIDYSKESTTLLRFRLDEMPDGVQLTVTESGFDQIPLNRRAKAFADNDGGWSHQMLLISKFLANESQSH